MVIGIVGGMGSYATVDLFRRVIDAFPAEKEWDRPRVIIDNYCTMPSRVRAILYNEKKDELCHDLSTSVNNLLKSGVNRVILACNTSHVFLPQIYDLVPESKGKILDIIDSLADEMNAKEIRKTTLIASEGTIETKIYDKKFEKYLIQIQSPTNNQFELLRSFIESIKQNILTKEVMSSFVKFIDECNTEAVILGCTELPILYSECIKAGYKFNKLIFDPLESSLSVLKWEFLNERNRAK